MMILLCVVLFILFINSVYSHDIKLPIIKRHKSTKIRQLDKRGVVHYAQLFNDDGSEYLIHVGIGTPPQNFTLSLDTGSSDLWVPSIKCPEDQCPLTRFDPMKSSTFKKDNTSLFHIQYGIGGVDGVYGRDDVYLGDAHVPQQLFGLAKSTHDLILLTSNNVSEVANGIFGLGPPSLTSSKIKYEPFLFQLARQGYIEKPIFSISMGSQWEDGWSGEMMIGGTNREKYIGDIEYAPVTTSESNYWMVEGKGITISTNKDSILHNITFDSVRGLIIDTGTTLTYVDHALAEEIVLKIAGGENNVALDQMSGTFIINCQSPDLDTTIEFILNKNNIKLTIPVKDLIIPMNGNTIKDATQCMFGIAPWMSTGTSHKMNKQGWILIGDSVLRSTYLVFDMEKNQIGFAKTRKSVTMETVTVSLGNNTRVSPICNYGFLLFMTYLCNYATAVYMVRAK